MSGFGYKDFRKKTDDGLQTQMPTGAQQLPKVKWIVCNAIGNGEDCGKLLLLGSTPARFCQVERRARFPNFSREDGNLDFSVYFMNSS